MGSPLQLLSRKEKSFLDTAFSLLCFISQRHKMICQAECLTGLTKSDALLPASRLKFNLLEFWISLLRCVYVAIHSVRSSPDILDKTNSCTLVSIQTVPITYDSFDREQNSVRSNKRLHSEPIYEHKAENIIKICECIELISVKRTRLNVPLNASWRTPCNPN
jgi:hypothetical protein